jgi:hypothetical protein
MTACMRLVLDDEFQDSYCSSFELAFLRAEMKVRIASLGLARLFRHRPVGHKTVPMSDPATSDYHQVLTGPMIESLKLICVE